MRGRVGEQWTTLDRLRLTDRNSGGEGWVGNRKSSDKSRMDLARWKLYDGYLRRMKDSGMLANMSIFEDGEPGSYGFLPQAGKDRLCRYVMARTSAFSHLWYVICFEWQESWTKDQVNVTGKYLQAHNPWKRLLSVHDWGQAPWGFAGEVWPTFIAAQPGNDDVPAKVNSYAIGMRKHSIPHLADEFGFNKTDSDARIRGNLWASLCGGAAGVGTGTELKAFQRFLAQGRVPFQRMAPANDLVQGGGSNRFCLAERGHHYVVYSQSGSFTLTVGGTGLTGRWFNPRDVRGSLGSSVSVPAGRSTFTPPTSTTSDWVLWIRDGTNLTSGTNYPSMGAAVVQVVVDAPSGK